MPQTLLPRRENRTRALPEHRSGAARPIENRGSSYEVYRGTVAGFHGLRIVQRWRCRDDWYRLGLPLANGVMLYSVAPEHIATMKSTALICCCCLHWAENRDNFECRFLQNHSENDHPMGLCANISRSATPFYDVGELVAIQQWTPPTAAATAAAGWWTNGPCSTRSQPDRAEFAATPSGRGLASNSGRVHRAVPVRNRTRYCWWYSSA